MQPVLIEPLWNWNRLYRQVRQVRTCLNRTFMELKWVRPAWALELLAVLIEPLWNWNRTRATTQQPRTRLNRTFMELKSNTGDRSAATNTGLNRTFMELKCDDMRELGHRIIVVLIEPLWNWNIVPLEVLEIRWRCLNRTFMCSR